MRRSVSTSLWIMFLIAFMSFSSIFSTTTITATSMSSMSQFDLVDHVLKESMPSLTNLDFQTLGRSPPTDLHTVVFMPKQLHQQELFQILYEVSDPLHKKYGNYWTKESIVDFTQDSSSIAFIKAFLAFHQISITKETLHSEYIYAQASIATWEKMFQTEFQVFSISANTNSGGSTGESRVVHRCYEYSLPKVLHDHVMAVFNTVHMPVMKRLDKHLYKSVDEVLPDSATSATPSLRDGSRSLTVDSQFPGYVTPSVIQSTYQVDIKAGNNLVSQGLYESLNQTMSPDDLSIFQQVFNLLLQPISGDTGHVSNSACYASLDDCIEANLDVQYIMGVGQGIPTYYDYDDSPDDDFLLNWITMIANSPNPHTVYSISYGAYEESMTKSYIDAFDMEVAKLGLMGTSVFASSGDDGVAGFYAKGNDSYCSFAPQYPASSPYVTAVGGTNVSDISFPSSNLVCCLLMRLFFASFSCTGSTSQPTRSCLSSWSYCYFSWNH